MIKKLIQEFGCDHPYCSSIIRVPTGSMAYGTNYSKEQHTMEKRGWKVYGFKHYCKKHRDMHNWGTMMTQQITGAAQ